MKKFALVISLILFFTGSAFAKKAPSIKGEWKAEQIADGVYVIHGPLELPNPKNQGFMNNPGFVITDAGVVVIDAGGSVQVGELLLGEIKRITDKPVVAAFNSHVHGDHWFGNHAIFEAYPDVKIYAHPNMIEEVNQGYGDEWMDMAMRLTEGAVEGTKVINATHAVDNGDNVQIGGIDFSIYHNGKAHTKTDIMIHVKQKQVMFLGDNAAVKRLLRNEGSFKGNKEALEIAMETQTSVFVPGHGQSGPDAAKIYWQYLKAMYQNVRKGFDEDLSDFEMKPGVVTAMGKWKQWADFDRMLGNHISRAYLEIEEAEF